MRLKFLLPLLTVAVLIISCFMPWMTVESKNLTITGVDTTGTTFRQPAYFHFIWAGAYLAFAFIPKIWAKRTTVGMAGFNLAWAARNFLLIPVCQMGECPVRREGLYLLLVAALGMVVAPLFTKDIAGNRK
ncbi:MAG TPA: hypothetical protein VMR70_16200 [Flavisolibacter sp.]|nr:hypothetical protein [Flavisolibacter sp.]